MGHKKWIYSDSGSETIPDRFPDIPRWYGLDFGLHNRMYLDGFLGIWAKFLTLSSFKIRNTGSKTDIFGYPDSICIYQNWFTSENAKKSSLIHCLQTIICFRSTCTKRGITSRLAIICTFFGKFTANIRMGKILRVLRYLLWLLSKNM